MNYQKLISESSLAELLSQCSVPKEKQLLAITIIRCRIESISHRLLEDSATTAAGVCARRGVDTEICQEVADAIIALE